MAGGVTARDTDQPRGGGGGDTEASGQLLLGLARPDGRGVGLVSPVPCPEWMASSCLLASLRHQGQRERSRSCIQSFQSFTLCHKQT